MRRVDYAKLEELTIKGWRECKNPDNDELVAAQIRAAEVAGKLSAFTASEVDRAKNADNMSIPFMVLAALTANQLNNMLPYVDNPERALMGFMQSLHGYTQEMLTLRQTGHSEVVTDATGPIELPLEEVPN